MVLYNMQWNHSGDCDMAFEAIFVFAHFKPPLSDVMVLRPYLIKANNVAAKENAQDTHRHPMVGSREGMVALVTTGKQELSWIQHRIKGVGPFAKNGDCVTCVFRWLEKAAISLVSFDL